MQLTIPRYFATVLALALVLACLSLVAVAAHPSSVLTIIYPTTGIGFAILWRFGGRWWPALFLAQFAVSLTTSNYSVAVATITAATETLTCIALLLILTRRRVSPDLARIRDLVQFTGFAVLVTGLAGVVIVVAEWFHGEGALSAVALDGAYWWAGDAISILVFAPLITTSRTWKSLRSSRFRLVAALSILLLSLGVGIALGGDAWSSALFLLLPIVIFNALLAGPIAGAAASGALLTFTLFGFAMSGATPVDLVIRLIFVATATLTGYVLGIVWTEREQAGQQLDHLARHDMLTGIFNRYEFENRLRDMLASKGEHALLYLDLDQFKLVNDTCGHMAGDSMLKEVAQQLASVLPPSATLGRLGGDEFGCLLPGTDEAAALRVAGDVHQATERYRFHFGRNDFGVMVSIGITIFGNAGGDTTDSVLSRADIACYLAKEEGHSETRVYRPADEAMLSWHAAIQEVSQVEQALASGKLSLFCQQIVAIGKRDDPHLYEVLLRLEEGGRWQSASEFLPLVQRFGLMERIDRWVLEKTCEFLATAGDPALRLSINISGATLNQPSFFEFAMAVPERYGIDASRICLEVTESVAIQRLRQAVEAMHKLRARGFDIALDDFGAGVASFGYLHELPVTMVKLDGRFVRDLRTDPAAEVIIDSLVRLSALRGVACVAEWVESEESIEQLRRLGVAYAQGFFIGMPKPLSSLVERQALAG